MARQEVAVKKYVVRLSAEERARLDEFDPQRASALGAGVLDESAHPAEGGRVGGRARAGATAGSPRRWTPASRRSSERDGNLSWKASKPS